MRSRHNMLIAKGLHKQYGKRMVVKEVDVSLDEMKDQEETVSEASETENQE